MAGHWKHGWIPLDPAAVKQKNHGSSSGSSDFSKKANGMLAGALKDKHPEPDNPFGGHSASVLDEFASGRKGPGPWTTGPGGKVWGTLEQAQAEVQHRKDVRNAARRKKTPKNMSSAELLVQYDHRMMNDPIASTKAERDKIYNSRQELLVELANRALTNDPKALEYFSTKRKASAFLKNVKTTGRTIF